MVITIFLSDRKLTNLKPLDLFKLFGSAYCPLTSLSLEPFETLLSQHLDEAYGLLNKNRNLNLILTRIIYNTFNPPSDTPPDGMMMAFLSPFMPLIIICTF